MVEAILRQWARCEGGVGGHVALGGGEELGGLGELASEDPDDLLALGPSHRLTEG
jgi:hypothetical protein